MKHTLFRELLAFFEELEAPQWDSATWQRLLRLPSIFPEIGLRLHRPPLLNVAYHVTPTNTRAFASTGLDGCYFNFLLVDGEVREDSPVIMTCPNGAPPNIVVGEDLRDFLCLGIGTGYAAVQDLSDRPKRFTRRYPAPGQFAPWVKAKERKLLRRLARRFGLTGWTAVVDKLTRLNQKYVSSLRYPLEYLQLFGAPEGHGGGKPGTAEDPGRKPMRFRLVRGGASLGTMREELDPERSGGLDMTYVVGRLIPSPAFADVAVLFQELNSLDPFDDETACDRIRRAILQPGFQMQDLESGETYEVQDIGVDGEQVSWTPFLMSFPDEESEAAAES